jgi:hypothetical protein
MRRKSLLWLSLCLSILGIIALLILKPEVSPQSLQMTGLVKGVYSKNGASFISFVPGNFTVVSFEHAEIEQGEHTLKGRLQQYEGRVEFVVEDID